MSTSAAMPSVSGPVKEATGHAKEELGEKLGNQKMAEAGRDLRNRGRMEQGKDIIVGTPGMHEAHAADDLKTKLEVLGGGTGQMKAGCSKAGCTCQKSSCADCQNYDASLGKPSMANAPAAPPMTTGTKTTV